MVLRDGVGDVGQADSVGREVERTCDGGEWNRSGYQTQDATDGDNNRLRKQPQRTTFDPPRS